MTKNTHIKEKKNIPDKDTIGSIDNFYIHGWFGDLQIPHDVFGT